MTIARSRSKLCFNSIICCCQSLFPLIAFAQLPLNCLSENFSYKKIALKVLISVLCASTKITILRSFVSPTANPFMLFKNVCHQNVSQRNVEKDKNPELIVAMA